jgi:Family of unknown function (DUF6978)
MSLATLTDGQISSLLSAPKKVENPGSRPRTEGKHIRRDFRVVSEDGHHEFVLFTRQSTVIPVNFSAGLRWKSRTGEEIILMRCNGSDHPHGNSIEGNQFPAQSHIHHATERYILAGKKAESFAQATGQYKTLAGAIHELIRLANIHGLETKPDEGDLFAQ